jgi:hypothetical protein
MIQCYCKYLQLLKKTSLVLCSFQLHSGITEVAVANARMFVNKPDGSMSFQNYLYSSLY